MTPQQRLIYDDVLRTRGNAQGPFLAWLLSPELAQPAQQLGAFCRYGTSLTLQETELLILIVAAHYQCPGEQQIHEPIALKAGLPLETVEAIRTGAIPKFSEPRTQLLAVIAQELLQTKRLSSGLVEQGVTEFGEASLVEIVAVIGYYVFVAYTLNAFSMG